MTTAAPRTSAAAAGDGCKEAALPPATKKVSPMKLPYRSATGQGCTGATLDNPLDLDSFLEDCLKPSEPAPQASSAEPRIANETSTDASCLLNELDLCFVPAPPSQSIVCRGISGIDFDAFFNECSPSGKEKVPYADTVKKQGEPASHSAFDVQMLPKSQSADPQSAKGGFSGIDFNSNAFFDEYLSS